MILIFYFLCKINVCKEYFEAFLNGLLGVDSVLDGSLKKLNVTSLIGAEISNVLMSIPDPKDFVADNLRRLFRYEGPRLHRGQPVIWTSPLRPRRSNMTSRG